MKQPRIAHFFAMAIVALAIGGCESESEPTGDAGADAATSAPPGDAAAATEPMKIEVVTGVPECDELLGRYGACLEKNPGLKSNEGLMFEARRTSLKMQAGTPEGKAGVATRCKALFAARLKTNCL